MEKSRDTKSNFPAIRALIFCVWFALHFKIVFHYFVKNALSAYKTKIYATCRSVISTTFRYLVGESYFMYQTPILVAVFKMERRGGGVRRGGEDSPLLAENADLS